MNEHQITKLVQGLARKHFQLEEGIDRFIWFKNGEQDEIRLIEINRNGIPEGAVVPFYLEPTEEAPLPILIGDITPDEWQKVRQGIIPLPEGWSLENSETITRDDLKNSLL